MDNSKLYSLEAEMAILGAIFNDQKILIEVNEIVNRQHFYDLKHQIIFDAFIRLNQQNKAIDLLTVVEDLKAQNLLDQAGGINYLEQLATSISVAINVATYADIVYEKFMIRQTIAKSREIIEYANNNNLGEDVINFAEQKILEISKLLQSGEFVDWQNLIQEFKQDLQDSLQTNKGRTGLLTGYRQLDKYTNGFSGGEFIILAARPSMGKTAFALNLMSQIAKKNDNPHIAFFSLEMPASQILMRFLAIESGVPISTIRRSEFQAQDIESLKMAMDKLQQFNFHIDETAGLRINELKSKARKLKMEYGLDAIFIDYLQLITTSNPNIGRVQEVSYISRELKAIAKELEVPVIALSQLSREVEKRINKKPQMSDLRDSGAIEQDADIIMMLYRPEYYSNDTEVVVNYAGETIVGIEKNRNGSTGDLEFTFNNEINLFLPTDTTHQG